MPERQKEGESSGTLQYLGTYAIHKVEAPPISSDIMHKHNNFADCDILGDTTNIKCYRCYSESDIIDIKGREAIETLLKSFLCITSFLNTVKITLDRQI